MAIDLPSFTASIGKIIEQIFNGVIKAGQTSAELAGFTASTLWQAVKEQFTGQSIDDSAADWLRVQQNNIYAFSVAKSFEMIKQMQSLVFDDNGSVRSFSDFRSDALALHNKYNTAWLEAEYNAAVRGTVMGKRWLDIAKDAELFPYLRYDTASDARVRPEHAKLNGIILPTNSAFWQIAYPPNGWNCRCDVTQLREAELTPEQISQIDESTATDTFFEEIKDRFWHKNTGTSQLFTKSGVNYFDALPVSGNELRAVKHYRLPSVSKKYKDSSKLIPSEPTTTSNTQNYFNSLGNEITDFNGQKVSLVSGKNIDPKFARAIEQVTTASTAMEVWESSQSTRVYILYYSTNPVIIKVKDGVLSEVKKVSRVTAEKNRRGTLIKN